MTYQLPENITQPKLETLRALETFQNATNPEIALESGISTDAVRRYLGELRKEGYVVLKGYGRSAKWNLADKGRALLVEADGMIVGYCKYCQEGEFVPEVSGEEYRELRHSCGKPYMSIRALRPASEIHSELVYPAPEGTPPTFINRRNQVAYTYEPYQDLGDKWHCGARCRDGKPHTFYSQFANHRCKHHGGKQGGPIVTGRYSKFLTGTTAEIFQEFLNDPELLDLQPEIALLRTRLVEEWDNMSPKVQASICDVIGKLATKHIEREQEMKYLIHVDQLNVLGNAITQVVLDDLTVCPHCGKSLDEVRMKIGTEIGKIKMIDRPEVTEAEVTELQVREESDAI